ncbi:hypothetical protein GCM10009546_23460 [Actinomadura livida]|uniref:Secreted protein n=1 Tax=Actinomadura livida TaxID=79909 RepID=A0ABN1E755_9ACTN|nr:hypothetical protein GCM10010208_06990 [Actinomadura livida]
MILLVFAVPGGRRCVCSGFGAAPFPTPGEPRRERNAAGDGAGGRRPGGGTASAAVVAARTGRPAARASAADRAQVRDLHALLPVFCCHAPAAGSAVRARHM